MTKYKGFEIELGGTRYVFPSLSLGAVERLQDKIDAVTSSDSQTNQISAIIDIAHASLKRNYPDITRDDVADLIDVSNIQTIFVNIMSTSGMTNVNKDEVGTAEAKK
jgi:hypothetical protein